ncbi:fluoride efflux transporter CrcB [Haladaptatus sp. NG-SE-30]
MVEPGHLVGFGGMLGAVVRHLVNEAVEREDFPTGTLTVNVVGSFVLGYITFLGAGNDVLLFVGTGACGSFTTFSSFSYNTIRLWETGEQIKSVAYAALNIVGSVLAIGIASLIVS